MNIDQLIFQAVLFYCPWTWYRAVRPQRSFRTSYKVMVTSFFFFLSFYIVCYIVLILLYWHFITYLLLQKDINIYIYINMIYIFLNFIVLDPQC